MSALRGPIVGVSAVVVRDGLVLVGLRAGSHGAGTWGFPGGKLDAGETPAQGVARELAEETGLHATAVEAVGVTNDVLTDAGLHFVTLHHRVDARGEPTIVESDKVREWRWCTWDELPEPRFAPSAALLATGWRPAP